MTITDNNDVLLMLQKYGQQHLLTFWDELTEDERCQLIEDIENIDFQSYLCDFQIAKEMTAAKKIKKVDDYLAPPPKEVCGSWAGSSIEDMEKYSDIGLRNISNGECCAILMAGGAGTRLGVNYPKGMYNVGLPSGKSLFQIQAERLLRLQNLAKDKFEKGTPIMWYIMTSDCTRDATMEYFDDNNYFGLSNSQVVFFEQLTLPVIGIDGKILLESKCKVSKSPDGNGGLYRALRKYKIIDDMKLRGIKYAHVYGVDNILIKIADPIFFGFFIDRGAECATKVVEKTSSTETVGVVVKVDGHYQIVEYSEIDKETTEQRDDNDHSKLKYRCGSICSHLFHVNFLERVCHIDTSKILVHHIALKSIPYINLMSGHLEMPDTINAMKMERFVFDVFPLANTFVTWEAERNQEFSALKNSPGSKLDCPETSKMSILNYHKQLIINHLKDYDNVMKAREMTIEISPLVSYAGEGLDNIDKMIDETKDSTIVLELNECNKVIISKMKS